MRIRIFVVSLALFSLSAPLPAATDADFVRQRPFPGPDGRPLPFKSDAEALDFLARGKVVTVEVLGGGINRTRRMLLEKDGIEAHAVFRTVDVHERGTVILNERFRQDFRDSYRFEAAAYRLSRLLGIEMVPPTLERALEGEKGTLQLWIYDSITEEERRDKKRLPPDAIAWTRQVQTKMLFDRLIHNDDRNLGNQLIDRHWNLWLIDHTRTFPHSEELYSPRSVYWCSREIFQKLKELDFRKVRRELSPYLNSDQLKALSKRWGKLVRYLEEKIAEKGEEAVLF